MKRERIDYLDKIKGFSILLVVFCHYPLLPKDTILGNIIMCIAWGAVPCFFMVTGGLMHQRKAFHWKKYLGKIASTYLVLCVWKAIYFLYYSLFTDITVSKVELFGYLFLFQEIEGISTGFIWFMYAYINVLLFYPISYFLFKNNDGGRKILLFSMALLFTTSSFVISANFILEILTGITGRNILKINSISKVIPFGNYAHMLFYFVMGAFLLEYREQIKEKMEKFLHLFNCFGFFLMLIGTGGLVLIKWCQTGSFGWENIYLENGYYWISTLIVSIGIYGVFFYNKKEGWFSVALRTIGKDTLGIYYLHYIFLYLYRKYWNLYWDRYNSVAANILKTIIIVFLCWMITNILKRVPIIRKLVT